MTAPATERISRQDIETKLREIRGDVDVVQDAAKPSTIMIGVAVALVVTIAYLAGKRRGKRKSTIVEVRRL